MGVPAPTLIGIGIGAASTLSDTFCEAGISSFCCCVAAGGRCFNVCATLTALHNPAVSTISSNTSRLIGNNSRLLCAGKETFLLRPREPQVDYWDTRYPDKRKNRAHYEAPKTENGCNSDGGIEEIVSVDGSR